MLLAVFISCNSQQTAEDHQNKTAKEREEKVSKVPLNSNAKWKADEPTKKNVAAMMQVLNDSLYSDAGKRMELYTNLKATIDTLVKECKMKGPDHDALHVWLENVLEELKELKEEDEEYYERYTTLKSAVSNFYESFE